MNRLPMVTCPSCENETQFDDYYDMRVGDERECRHCGATIEVTEVDTCTYVKVRVHPTVKASQP